MNAIPGSFHDAVLVSVVVEWSRGEVRLALRTPDGSGELLVSGSTAVSFSRLHPWGPSASINHLTVVRCERGIRVQLEMQSGDSAHAEGAAVSWLASSSPPI